MPHMGLLIRLTRYLKRPLFFWAGTSVASVLALNAIASSNFLLFHTLVELATIVFSINIFLIAIHAWDRMEDAFIRNVSFGYGAIAVLDVLHTIAYKGVGIFADYDYYSPQFWIAARFVEAAGLVFAYFSTRYWPTIRMRTLLLLYALPCAYFIYAILISHNFPLCFVPGSGLTPFKIWSEYAICVILLLGLAGAWATGKSRPKEINRLLAAAIFFMVLTELCFTKYHLTGMDDRINQLGHIFKLIAYFLLYQAFVAVGLRDPFKVLHSSLQRRESALVEAQRIAKIGSWNYDISKQKLVATEEFYRFFCLPYPSPMGLNDIYGFAEASSRDALVHGIQNLIENRISFDATIPFLVDGRLRHGHLRAFPHIDPYDPSQSIAGTLQDSTEQVKTLALLKRSQESERFKLLLDAAVDGIHVLDTNGYLLEANDTFCKGLGYSRQEALKLNVADWDVKFTREERREKLQKGLFHEETFETVHRKKDGTRIDVEVRTRTVEFNNLVVLVCSSRDITDRKEAVARAELAANVFRHAREGIAIADAAGNLIEVNDSFSRITGYTPPEVLGKNPRFLHSGLQDDFFYVDLWKQVKEKGYWSGEIWNRRRDGSVYPQQTTITSVPGHRAGSVHYVSLFSDITANKKHEEELEQIAHFDPLTKLPNRVLLLDRLRIAAMKAHRHGRGLAVAYLDLDGFKKINDTYGHEVGDEFLAQISAKMNAVLRKGDTLARIGGDEFVALLTDVEASRELDCVLHRLLDAAATPIKLDGRLLQVTVSIGISVCPRDAIDADQLIRNADHAMYEAKQAGRGQIQFFDLANHARSQSLQQLVQELRAAMQEEQLELWYQPRVNMRTGAVVGAEALLRWHHPERGLLTPLDFLPAVSGHACELELSVWVLRSALAQIAAWDHAGMPMSVSVNLSAYQLLSGDFFELLLQILGTRSRDLLKHLEIEILESSALLDVAVASELVNKCAKLGVSFALDDFGTGFSSFSHLRWIPEAAVKIDKSFVLRMETDPDDLAIVEGIIGLASAFRRQVIAEGVENADQASILLALGCELAQGFGIAHPMPVEKILPWIGAWNTSAPWVTFAPEA